MYINTKSINDYAIDFPLLRTIKMAVPTIEKKNKVKKVTLVMKEKKEKKGEKEKKFDPSKTNAVQVLHRIAFTHVDDRMLMNNEAIEKNEVTKKFLGYDNPTTCQLNLNFLYCKAISTLERRLAVVEKQLKQLLQSTDHTNSPVIVSTDSNNENVSGKKRKRSGVVESKTGDTFHGKEPVTVSGKNECEKPNEIIDLDGGETKAE